MINKSLTIINKLGLHARASAQLVNTASKFKSDIQISYQGRTANGKSIMGIMMLAAGKGATIDVQAEGNDAEKALKAIEMLVNDYFGEGE